MAEKKSEQTNFLAKYASYNYDLYQMENARHGLLESLPWPTFARPSFNDLPTIVPIYSTNGKVDERTAERYSYIAFDAGDSSHPFSNDFVAPFPMKGSIVHTVQNLKLSVGAGEFYQLNHFS